MTLSQGVHWMWMLWLELSNPMHNQSHHPSWCKVQLLVASQQYCGHLYRTDKKKRVKESCNRPGVAQRVPGGLGSQISMTFSTWRWWGYQHHAPAAFTRRKCSWYSFSLGAELTPGPWYGREEYVTEKSSETTGNRSRERPTSSAVP